MLPTNARQLFIVWAPYGRRSELLARELRAALYFVHYLTYQKPLYAPPKYVLQSIRTLQILFKERPAVTFVQSPPFVCGLVVYLYCRLSGARLVLDHHSASFGRRWAWARPVQQWLARRAITNIVTNQHWAQIIRGWSAHAFVLPDPFVDLPPGESVALAPGFCIACVNTFAADEPLDAVLEAAARASDVHFYITGNKRKRPAAFFAAAPPNVTFTDFLPDSQYLGLLRSVHAVMSLTTRDHTLQSGGCEAVSLGKALITSDWPYLRELFARGTVYVANSAAGIYDGVRQMQARYRDLEQEIVAFREQRRREWEHQFAQLTALIAQGCDGVAAPGRA